MIEIDFPAVATFTAGKYFSHVLLGTFSSRSKLLYGKFKSLTNFMRDIFPPYLDLLRESGSRMFYCEISKPAQTFCMGWSNLYHSFDGENRSRSNENYIEISISLLCGTFMRGRKSRSKFCAGFHLWEKSDFCQISNNRLCGILHKG